MIDMDLSNLLPTDEIKAIDALYAELAAKEGWLPRRLDEILERWFSLVADLEEGAPPSWASYLNEMHLRYNLDELVRHLPSPTSHKLADILKPWDKRFEEATQEVTGDETEEEARAHGYWTSRIPKKVRNAVDDYRKQEWIKMYPGYISLT